MTEDDRDYDDFRQPERWTWGLRAAMTLLPVVVVVAVVLKRTPFDVVRILVLAMGAVVIVLNLVSLWHTTRRLRHVPYPSPAVRAMDSGRRDRILLVVIVLAHEMSGTVARLGRPHLNYHTPLLLVVLWLALSVSLKIDVRRWKAYP